ncbi:nitrilase-related carbon-nitrogen hydrolase [Kineococcus rhizosphaerae]|uniref:Putative amidohydrolase n=1 Tax=Kineococcus rhizosphaerae TaxID=559628 RepID=A0A2T0QXW1_9ACTN|nr:nitrilase-related carbon-nitrogen hydrolase [Kineococcus rhizosphaerae]PRY10857.1 putative amidohydrolase [Kineococcus rhizosphaerae]
MSSPANPTTRVACHTSAPRIGDLAGNCDRSVDAVRAAVAAGADLVVLPELVTSGYVFASVEEAAGVAIGPDHDVFTRWARAAGDAVVVGGFCERGCGGTLFNSAAVVDRTGVLAVYRKLHLWDEEKRFFAAGDELPPVLDVRFGRLAPLICYDLEFPELTRHLALAGAEVLAVPTNWPLGPRPDGERPPEVVIAMAAARVNRVVVVCCDRTGTERGQRWTAGTTVVGADGWPVAVQDEGLLVTDVDLAPTRDKRLTERAHLFEDRRTDLY